ncbi:S41 family peptidase [Mucilaginibacter lacusdianchii]|uniref:S41 family peptidase n=1 Tax=Mucilaginibacter lacusdianchii TaxID=2684211 RepID=UPI00131D5077|nr:S41 family peptidase [Mucilaginibacter sp. JXJ CY 39]
MLKKITTLIVSLSFPCLLLAQQPLSGADSARMIIDSVLNYARHKSIYRGKVNWTMLTDSVKKHSANARSVKEVMPSVGLVYQLLGDFHGFAIHDGKYYKWWTTKAKLDTVVYRNLRAKMKQKPSVESRMLQNSYGYLLIPGNNPTHPGESDLLAQQIQDSLTKLHPEKLKGLIIDLRANPGGNMYPMILGVGNLLGNGQFGSFIDPVTKQQEAWGIKGKAIYGGLDTVCHLKTLGKASTKLKVALLIGPMTASSGEATAITFKGRKNAILIGEKTAGYTTANDSFRIFDINVIMATSTEADRNGTPYYENVLPDIEAIAGDDFNHPANDAKINAALKWLKGK